MSDHTATDDTEVETTDAPVDEQATGTEETHPWGDDFDPARAWNTIQQQREAEKTAKAEADALREDAEFAKALRNDPAALRSFLEEQGFEVDEEDDGYDDQPANQPTPAADPRVDTLLAAEQRRAQREAEQQFEADFTEALGEREINAKARKWIEAQTVIGGNDADALKQAVEEWFELTTPPAPKPKPRAPHVPSGGPPADEAPAGTHQDRVQRALDRMQAESA